MKNPQNPRLATSLGLLASLTLLTATCATTTPVELSNARVAYDRASRGPAAQLTPADLHKAKVALDQAEQSFAADQDSQKTVDLAYIAERTAQIAEARAQTAQAESKTAQAKQDLGAKQGEIAAKTQGALLRTREELGVAEQGRAQEAQQAAVERTSREQADRNAATAEAKAATSEQNAAAAEQKAKEANDALAKLAAKDEARGMVITLSGSVLFRSNDAALLPESLTRLDQVAGALVAKGQDVVVEGYTDSRGSQTTNMNLSQRRAESVRSYLVSRGFPSEKIQAHGLGADRPVAENSNAEGRANNRRVEIVIAKAPGRQP